MASENTDLKETSKYQENYDILKTAAEDLKAAEEIDIDELLEKVKKAMTAYEFCKSRIDTVQSELDKLLEDAPSSGASNEDAAEKKQQSSDGDDIPF